MSRTPALDEQSRKVFMRLRFRITAICSIALAIVFGLILVAMTLTDYASRLDNVEQILSSSIEKVVESRPDDILAQEEHQGYTELGIDKRFDSSSYIPIIIYKADYANRLLLPVDIETAQLTDATMIESTEELLRAKVGFHIISNTSLAYYKETTDAGDLIAFTDISTVMDYMLIFVQRLGSVIIFAVAFLTAGAWSLSNKIVAPVREMWQKQQRFIADASHELKTPVSVIIANAEIIGKNTDDTEDVSVRTECITEEGEKMKLLIEDMMYLLTDKALDAKKEPLDFSHMCMRSAMMFEPKAWDKQNMLEYEDIEDDVEIIADAYGVERVVSILLDNAVKYAAPSTEISVSLTKGKKHAYLSVSNKGPVIPEESLEAIFDRFYRTDDARTRTKEASYGLGLAMAKDIVDANDGKIYATSSPESTTFFLVLPLAK